jgi:hypothetical protein
MPSIYGAVRQWIFRACDRVARCGGVIMVVPLLVVYLIFQRRRPITLIRDAPRAGAPT